MRVNKKSDKWTYVDDWSDLMALVVLYVTS